MEPRLPETRPGSSLSAPKPNPAMATAAGFETIDLSNVYDGYELDTVRIAEWDQHPSVLGHQLIADRLYLRSDHP